MVDSSDSLSETEEETWKEIIEKDYGDLTDKEITSKIKLSIKRRYSYPEWVLVFEYSAPNGRQLDAIALNTLPSRNFKVVGFEFKASRGDWLREKRDGEKADYFVKICDEFWVVAGGTDIVKESELPEGWGLLELKPNSERIYKERESQLTDYQQGEPDRRFWVKMINEAVGNNSNYTQGDLIEARRRGHEAAMKDAVTENMTDIEADRLRRKADRWDTLQENGFDFVYNLSGDQLKQLELAFNLVKLLSTGNYHSLQHGVERLTSSLDRTYEDMREMTEDLEAGLEALHSALEDSDLPDAIEGDE